MSIIYKSDGETHEHVMDRDGYHLLENIIIEMIRSYNISGPIMDIIRPYHLLEQL